MLLSGQFAKYVDEYAEMMEGLKLHLKFGDRKISLIMCSNEYAWISSPIWYIKQSSHSKNFLNFMIQDSKTIMEYLQYKLDLFKVLEFDNRPRQKNDDP